MWPVGDLISLIWEHTVQISRPRLQGRRCLRVRLTAERRSACKFARRAVGRQLQCLAFLVVLSVCTRVILEARFLNPREEEPVLDFASFSLHTTLLALGLKVVVSDCVARDRVWSSPHNSF